MLTNESSKENLERILDVLCDNMLVSDGNGVILKVGDDFEKMYGLEPGEILGKTVAECERRGIFKPSLTRLVLEERRKITHQQVLLEDGKEKSVIVTAVPIFDDDDNLIFVVSFTRDVTEFMILQQQYNELEDRVELYEEELAQLRTQQIIVDDIIGTSPQIRSIMQTIGRVAAFDANVLLTGESGVGKSLFAKSIHKLSSRKDGPFIEINCGAIPETLLESELFGYTKGSFTGARSEGKTGLIELAQGGTLFLDEIAELPLNLQVKVLRVIQEKKIMKIGGTEESFVDFRLIAATNRNLDALVKQGSFREDLYYRLKVIPIEIPALRERKEDILPLATHFLDQCNAQYGLSRSLSPIVTEAFMKYDWPGNIRELENLVERMSLTSETDVIGLSCLPSELKDAGIDSESLITDQYLNTALESLERKMVINAYEKTGTTIGVAELLGISQPTAVRKIQKYIQK